MGGIAASVAALGNGSGPGDLGIIQVAQAGQTLKLLLTWDADAAKWVSKPLPTAIVCNDGDWMQNQQGGAGLSWQYFGSFNSALARWDLRAGAIPFAGALYAAGLRLQDCAFARLHDAGAGVPILVAPWFFQLDPSDPLVLDNDASAFAGKTWNGLSAASYGFQPSSGNLGHGVVLESDQTGGSKIYSDGQYEDHITSSGYHSQTRAAGWDYVKLFAASSPAGSALGGVPTSTPATPTKMFLYPTLYGYGGNSAGTGAAAYVWRCRWAS